MNPPLPYIPDREAVFAPLSGGLPPPPDDEREIGDYIRSVLRRKWLVLGLGLIAAGIASVVAMSMPPIFRSTATVLIETGKSKILSIDEVYSGPSQDREHYQTQVEILKSREIAYRTVMALKLWEAPEFDPRRPEGGWFDELKTAIGIPRDPEPKWSEQRLADATVGRFIGNVNVEAVRLSQLVKVSFEARDNELAALAANTFADMYIETDRESRFKMTQSANEWLQERMSVLRDRLGESERALQAYREQQGLVNIGGSAQTLEGQQLGQLTQRLVEARVKRSELESAYQQIGSVKDEDFASMPSINRDVNVAEARARVSVAKRKLAVLAESHGAQYSGVTEAEAELKAAQDDLRARIREGVASLTREYRAARATELSIENALAEARGTIQDVSRREFELGVLEREVQANKQIYDLFISRAKETNVGGALQSQVARVVDPAAVSFAPVKPARAQIVLFALIVGLATGVVIALFSDSAGKTVQGSDDAEARLQLPVLAVLPELRDEARPALARLFLDQPNSLHAEAIRTARTGILLSNIGDANKVLLVTGSVREEGKTSICTNLALALAQTRRTLLIDANMRDPMVGTRLGLPADAKGLSDLVAGTATFAECVHAVPGTSLMVIPAGTRPPNPLELLLSERFRTVLESVTHKADIALIDSPSVEVVSDALVIAPAATGCIYVVKAQDTPIAVAQKGITRIQRAGGRVVGVLVNSLDFSRSREPYPGGAAPPRRRDFAHTVLGMR